MHYLTYVFIDKDAGIEEAVAAALRPYGDGFEVKPWKRYLGEGEVTAMAKCYGLPRTGLRGLAARMEDWNGGLGGVDRGGLYAVLTYNPEATWDWYEVGGRWSGRWRGNATLAGALLRSPRLKALLPHDFLTPDAQWHARSKYVSTGWLEGHFVHTPERRWLKEFTQALATWPHHRVVCVDRHC
jgi:hypothetical protein